jgi:Cysteine-rich CPXCG
MNRQPARKRRPKHEPNPDDSRDIDAVYGLEPVFEPATAEGAGDVSADAQLRRVQCPYCGERFETVVDLSGGSSTYVEDCQVCCRPIEFTLGIDPDGGAATLVAKRSD